MAMFCLSLPKRTWEEACLHRHFSGLCWEDLCSSPWKQVHQPLPTKTWLVHDKLINVAKWEQAFAIELPHQTLIVEQNSHWQVFHVCLFVRNWLPDLILLFPLFSDNADSSSLNAVTFLRTTEILTVNSIGQLKIWDFRKPGDKPLQIFSL